MKRFVLVIVLAAVLIGLLASPAAADQAFQTTRAPFYSANPALYPLQQGFVVAVHMNGPVYFEKKEFQLHGAKPNTEFFIYRMFDSPLLNGLGQVVAPANTPLYAGFSIVTDKHGNGHIMTPLLTTAPVLQAIRGTVSVGIKNLLYEGLGGTLAYEADWYTTYFDWRW